MSIEADLRTLSMTAVWHLCVAISMSGFGDNVRHTHTNGIWFRTWMESCHSVNFMWKRNIILCSICGGWNRNAKQHMIWYGSEWHASNMESATILIHRGVNGRAHSSPSTFNVIIIQCVCVINATNTLSLSHFFMKAISAVALDLSRGNVGSSYNITEPNWTVCS